MIGLVRSAHADRYTPSGGQAPATGGSRWRSSAQAVVTPAGNDSNGPLEQGVAGRHDLPNLSSSLQAAPNRLALPESPQPQLGRQNNPHGGGFPGLEAEHLGFCGGKRSRNRHLHG
jgi:hypothetical protein